MTDDARFWRGVERIENDYIGDCDRPRFRRRMKRKGFDAETIEDRVKALDFDSSAWRGSPPPD